MKFEFIQMNINKSILIYPKVIPIVKNVTARYLNSHVMKANATMNTAGKHVPRQLKNFRVFVIVKICFRTIVSDSRPVILIVNQRQIYGNADNSPF